MLQQLMAEVPNSRKDHGCAEPVRGRDYIRVFD